MFLGAPPAQKKTVYASAEGASGENFEDFRPLTGSRIHSVNL